MCVLGKLKIMMLAGLIAFGNVTSVYADNVTKVLQIYNVGIEQIDTTAIETELTKASLEYSRVEAEYKERQTSLQTVELTSKIIQDSIMAYDATAASLNMQRKEDYLKALVNIDADLDKIFDAEKDYREANSQLGAVLEVSGILSSRLDSLNIYSEYLPETNSDDVKKAEKDFNVAKDKLKSAKNLTDIGAVNDLKYPVNYSVSITSKFGVRNDPFGGSGTEFHYGLDMAAPAGSEVISLFNGVISKAGADNGLGNYIIVSHSKEFQTLYAHLSEIKVKVGDKVRQYDLIGTVGSTGRSTGPHLHLGVYINGQKVDPMKLFAKG